MYNMKAVLISKLYICKYIKLLGMVIDAMVIFWD